MNLNNLICVHNYKSTTKNQIIHNLFVYWFVHFLVFDLTNEEVYNDVLNLHYEKVQVIITVLTCSLFMHIIKDFSIVDARTLKVKKS